MKKRILSLLLAAFMIMGMLPVGAIAESTDPYAANLEKQAKFAYDLNISSDPEAEGDWSSAKLVPLSVVQDLIVVTKNYKIVADRDEVWYEIAPLAGETLPEEFGDMTWVFHDKIQYPMGATLVFRCDACGEFGCTEIHETCPACGQYNCTAIHFFCRLCQKYDCGRDHLHCPACGQVDCAETHVWCGLCAGYDCRITHENTEPDTLPVIPEAPVMTEGADVSVVNEKGDPVTEEGFLLIEGMKSSLSAWCALGENVLYQWQIRYDNDNDLWADIAGQKGKGILITPAMILSILREQGSTAIRCAVTADGKTLTSAAIPVRIAAPEALLTAALGSGSDASDVSAVNEDEENKVDLVINYVFANGKIAANPWAASLPAGVAYSTTTPITIPTIPGYTPAIGEGANSANATLNGYRLSLSFSGEDLKKDCSVTVVYQPAPVKVVVEHYQQNIYNDNYTLFAAEELSLVTGSTVGDVHKDYAGFYSLLYEHPTVAADGSTVVQVYYDRYYYLMKFELDGGYGADPVYARFGAAVEIGTPTRAGYEFGGWADENGNAVTIPAAMSENGGTYYADWDPQETRYATAYWVMNDDGTKTYIGSEILTALSGSTVSGGNTLTANTNVCALLAHTHNSTCRQNCTGEDHIHGDGNCVYSCGKEAHDHTSGCTCTQTEHTPHNRSCYVFQAETVNNYSSFGVFDYAFTVNGLGVYTNRYYEGYYYVEIGGSYYRIDDYSGELSLVHTMTCHTHSDACCDLGHEHTDCVCTLHSHTEECYSCGLKEHTHTADCKTDLAKYVEFVEARQNVTVNGDGSTVVDVYYTYKTYTIRFIYAKKTTTGYQIAKSTGNGTFAGCSWTSGGTYLPTFRDPSGKTERSTVEIGGTTYYYISLSAKYGADISAIWPSGNMGNAGTYEWGSWAAAAGTGYREKYGDAHANIVGPYPTMSADMIVENPEKLEDGTYLAQNMIAWWGVNENILPHAYHNYFELLPGEEEVAGKVYVTYEGKRYRLEETYVFTAAHNGTTRVDPIFYSGYVCINDSRDTSNDTQANSNNYRNNGNCALCGDTCNYCNTFYYDRNGHSLYFWNYNGYLREGTGAQVVFGEALTKYGAYVSDAFMNQSENYPDQLETDAYRFAGWYTTSDCLDGTQMDWTTTMPDSDMTVYAKWVPVPRTVRFFLDRADMDADTIIPEKMASLYAATHGGAMDPDSPYLAFATRNDVPNKSYITDVTVPGVSAGYENHPYSGYTFVGWFYLDSKGSEKAFDPANMPVTHNLDLYGKWSSNVLCPYEIRFMLDENGNGILDAGETTHVADPITGSTLAGNARTFDAKGDTALFADYQSGYFPNVSSHTIDFKASNEAGVIYSFLYKQSDPVAYTVEYRDTATGERIVIDGQTVADKHVDDNTKAVVTENFKPVSGYMPDAYQKTLVIVPDGNNVIVFYYTKDIQHALYQVNHYIENLGGGWTEYHSATFTGEIGKDYFASAETISGFGFSDALTNRFNTEDQVNAFTGTALPGEVRFSAAADTVTGTLTGNGMQLNLYYTRNEHTYKVQYLEFGTETVLHPEKTGQAKYNELVAENAAYIQIDLDGDGQYEDFRLYEATKDPQTATIKDDSTVLKFYYIRCTQDLSVTKTVADRISDDGNAPDPDQVFNFLLTIHANDFHQTSYPYEIRKDGRTVDSGYKSVSDDGQNRPQLSFTLKDGETITFDGLPTAEYTISEQEIPLGYYETYAPGQDVKLTVDDPVSVTVTNTYEPAVLEVSKTVEVEEEDTNTPEKEEFEFTIQVSAGVTGSFSYTVAGEEKTVTVADGKMVICLKNGQSARFTNLPLGNYTVTETDFSAFGYNSYVSVNGGEPTEGLTAQVKMERGTTNAVDYRNKFPVGDLKIQKTVSKEFYGAPWNGDTFTFTVSRTDAGRPLLAGNRYDLYEGTAKVGTAQVSADGTLQVTVTFDGNDAAAMDEPAEKNASVTRTLIIKDLPTGSYRVEESENALYVQSQRVVTDLVIPAEEAPTAAFTNRLIRPTGSLYLEKELVAAEGYYEPLPEDTEFSFTITLTQEPPETATVQVANSDGAVATVNMVDGAFVVRLKAGQHVLITGLPIGSYRITEATLPYYANSFAHKIGGNWVAQPVASTSDGRMYTDISVVTDQRSDVLCTNTYPVNRTELIIQKLVTKAYDRDTLPGESFTFTVTLAETDLDSYDYTVYSRSGAEIRSGTVTVTDKQFTLSLEAGQYAVIDHMPVCGYSIRENVSGDYRPSYQVYQWQTDGGDPDAAQQVASGSGAAVSRTFVAGKTEKVVFTNEYRRHLGQLTITKTVSGNPPAADTFLFHIYKGTGESKQKIMDVTVQGQGSITVYDLPLGIYTVVEDSAWSWRYTAADTSETVELTMEDLYAEAAFANTYQENHWLNYFGSLLNEFLAPVTKGDDD